MRVKVVLDVAVVHPRRYQPERAHRVEVVCVHAVAAK